MVDRKTYFGNRFLLVGLFFVVFVSLIFGNHYYKRGGYASLYQHGESSGSYSGGSGSYPPTSTTDPSTGTTTYTYTDPATGQTYTSTSTTDSSGTTTYTYTDAITGQTSTYTSTTDSSGTTTYTYTDPATGQTQTSTYTSTSSGAYTTTTSSGESYTYDPAQYGATYDASANTYSGTTPNGETWTYNVATGEYTLNGVAQNINSGPGGSTAGEVVITDSGTAYTFDRETMRQSMINNWIAAYGIPPSDKALATIDAELDAYAAGESAYAGALEHGLPVAQLEPELKTETTFTDYAKSMETQLGRPLTEEEKQYAYARYEEWKEEQTSGFANDYFDETHEGMKEFYEDKTIPEQYQFFEVKSDYETMLEWHREYEKRVDAGEDKAALEREFYDRFTEKFKEPEAIESPEIIHPETARERINGQFATELNKLESQGLSIGDSHPLSNQLRTKMEAAFEFGESKKEAKVIEYIQGNCQGKFGDSQEACGKQVEAVQNINSKCSKLDGDAQSACYDTVQQVVELDCSGISNSKKCATLYKEIEETVVDKVSDSDIRPVFLHQVEFLREQQMAIGIYDELKECQSAGGSSCEAKASKAFKELLVEDKELFDAQAEPLSNDLAEMHERIVEFEEQRSAFNSLVDPAMKEAGVPENLLERLSQKEENKAMLMMEFTDAKMKKLIEEGKSDSEIAAELKDGIYYNCLYEQFMSASKDSVSHKNYRDMAANLKTAELTLSEFMNWAREEAK